MSKVLQGESHTQDILHMNLDNDSSRKRNWGLLVTGIVGGTLVVLYAVATPFITPALRKICLPFVPATSTQIENVLKMLQYRSGSLVDLGSGDGRIVSACTCIVFTAMPLANCTFNLQVIAAAKEGFKAVGYELNPWLVWYSRYRAWREGMHHNAKFYISDLWKVSFSQYTNVVVFGVPQMMPQLEKKLEEELDHNARVVACRFPFPHWMPDHTTGEGIDVVWAYDSKAFKGNEKTLSETVQKMHPL
nr:ATP synthase subunit C lysine N-methyltransferase isoform X1 [Chrysemys picta bellii]XP_042715806.1 ATP synthase subunit C lysine N-methyltransferase isoform X1 [Chrysemys picta bellii]XP_042715807.1 ATP synthase subunit C lysine N-methyltransferase isoform X1 [Chrysemys picta bellii]XP_042715808.1 ATP synthase subunit C lysine N-methyltransferase isoform X1 [Chrysemys picta bellii]XP_042715809.1 ATP synthase subunit C lysine N-methyltransferase isoform X1 [Chrysemys picta bellii]